LVDALLAVFESRVSPEDVCTLHTLLRELFPSNVRLRTSHGPAKQTDVTYNKLNDAVITQLLASGLQPTNSLVSKVKLL